MENPNLTPDKGPDAKDPASNASGNSTKGDLFKGILRRRKSKRSRWQEATWYRVKNYSGKDINLKKKKKPDEIAARIFRDTARVFSHAELEEIDQRGLEKREHEGDISIRKLDYKQDRDYSILNLTSKRIAIQHNYEEWEFFVPAFGSRNLSGKTLLDLDYTPWEGQGLIEVHPRVDEVKNSGAEAIISLTTVLLGLFLLISVPMAIFQIGSVRWNMVGSAFVVGIVIIGGALLFKGGNNEDLLNEFGNSLKLVPGIALVLGLGIGLPVGIIFFYGDGPELVQLHRFELAALGRLLQAGFIAIASLLPAFLFYLFGRQQVAKQRENFYREVMLLDPNVWSNSEAKNKYDPLLNSVYDTGNSPFSILLLVISTVLLINGWIIALSPIGVVSSTAANLTFFFNPDRSPFTFGFLGVYFFTVNMIYRRYIRADLTPKTYAYITMRLLITVVLVWAVSTLPQFKSGSLLEASLSIVAFMIGIFPESGLTLIQDYFNKAILKRRDENTNPDIFALAKLEGMNLYDQARLLEEGIENIENLAHHNLMELIARTRIPTSRLVDMFDQAILYLHLGPTPQTMSDLLKGLGVRTATDLLRCEKEIERMRSGNKEYDDLQLKLRVIIAALKDDEWLNYIQNWRDNSSLEERPAIDDPYQFYYLAIGIEPPSPKEQKEIDPVQIGMPAGEEDMARAFYVKLLGFQEIPKPDELAKRGGAWFRADDVQLHLGVEDDFKPVRKAHPAFIVSNLESLIVKLKEAGYQTDTSQPMISGYKRAQVFDPFGNQIELMEDCRDQ